MKALLALLLLLVGAVGASTFLSQERMIFYPEKLPEDYSFSFKTPFEERWVKVRGERIHSLYFHAASPRGAILYFHGNAGSLASWGLAAEQLVFETSYDVWMVDFPGYGKSEGTISSERQLHEMAQAHLEQLLREKPRANFKTVIFGRSIGSGLAVPLAASPSVDGLILETPYPSLAALAKDFYPWLPGFLLRYPFDSLKDIPNVSCPILILHGTDDEIISFRHGKTLAEAAGPRATFVPIPHGHHNDLGDFPEYWTALSAFLQGIK